MTADGTRFDEAYYDRFYKDPGSRVSEGDEVERLEITLRRGD